MDKEFRKGLGHSLSALLAGILIPTILITVFFLDSSINLGFKFGYHGTFNTIKEALESIPGIEIVRAGGNRDITFEEMAFDIRCESGEEITLFFGEQDPIRSMSGTRLKRALEEKIRQQIDALLDPTSP